MKKKEKKIILMSQIVNGDWRKRYVEVTEDGEIVIHLSRDVVISSCIQVKNTEVKAFFSEYDEMVYLLLSQWLVLWDYNQKKIFEFAEQVQVLGIGRNFFAVTSNDKDVRVYNIETGEKVKEYYLKDRVLQISFVDLMDECIFFVSTENSKIGMCDVKEDQWRWKNMDCNIIHLDARNIEMVIMGDCKGWVKTMDGLNCKSVFNIFCQTSIDTFYVDTLHGSVFTSGNGRREICIWYMHGNIRPFKKTISYPISTLWVENNEICVIPVDKKEIKKYQIFERYRDE